MLDEGASLQSYCSPFRKKTVTVKTPYFSSFFICKRNKPRNKSLKSMVIKKFVPMETRTKCMYILTHPILYSYTAILTIIVGSPIAYKRLDTARYRRTEKS